MLQFSRQRPVNHQHLNLNIVTVVAINPQTRHYSSSELSEKCLDEICALKMQYWDYPLISQKAWIYNNIHSEDLHVLTTNGDRLVAYLLLVRRPALTAKSKILVAGVSTVCVVTDLAGQGYGREIVSFANRLIDSILGTIGLLQCGARISPFYKKCGWRDFTLPVHVLGASQKKESFLRDECVMVYSSGELPHDDITIMGERF